MINIQAIASSKANSAAKRNHTENRIDKDESSTADIEVVAQLEDVRFVRITITKLDDPHVFAEGDQLFILLEI